MPLCEALCHIGARCYGIGARRYGRLPLTARPLQVFAYLTVREL